MTDSLQKQILSLLPSENLKKEITNKSWHFSDRDLLAIAWHYAPDFDARIDLLRLLEQQTEGDLKAYIRRIIETQRQMLAGFKSSDARTVFELHIKDTPDSYDERYLCSSFEAALKMIPLFYQEYDSAKETDRSRYEITKRRVFSGADGDPFAEDELGSLTLLPGARVYSIDVYSMSTTPEPCDGECLSCLLPCVSAHEILFPCFTKNGDAVRYTDRSGAISYGVVLQEDERPCADCYLIPLDSNVMYYHDFENVHNAHQHIPAPLVEPIAPEELPERMKKDFEAFRSYYLR